jgi:hypothetical protein
MITSCLEGLMIMGVTWNCHSQDCEFHPLSNVCTNSSACKIKMLPVPNLSLWECEEYWTLHPLESTFRSRFSTGDHHP